MKRILALFCLLLIAAFSYAQDTIAIPDPIGPGATVQNFIDLYGMLEGAIIVVLGYLHNFIPGLNKINDKWTRIILIAAVVIVIFTALGWQSGFGQVLIFLQAVGFYQIILKKAGASSPAINPPRNGR